MIRLANEGNHGENTAAGGNRSYSGRRPNHNYHRPKRPPYREPGAQPEPAQKAQPDGEGSSKEAVHKETQQQRDGRRQGGSSGAGRPNQNRSYQNGNPPRSGNSGALAQDGEAFRTGGQNPSGRRNENKRKIKVEETVEDVRKDIQRIEKEIELEIREITVMKLGL